MERRLAAVLVADVVGYSRHSQIDEEGTRVRFRADLRDIFEPKLAEHHGRLVKTMGDGLLVEFQSVVDAVRCAIDVQRAKSKQNEAVSDGKYLTYRIGINLGDVIVEGDDIHGDGVNVAARLEAIAEAGGVAISGTAYDQVKNKVAAGFAFLGEQLVKNISEPVRIYRVLTTPETVGKTISIARRPSAFRRVYAIGGAGLIAAAAVTVAWLQPLASRTPPAIVVLPFENLSADAQQSYFADGLTDDLTTALSRVPGLFVLSRHAAFRFKGKPFDPPQLAAELGVRYVLNGAVQRAGSRLRINVQLMDAKTSGDLWAQRFDGTSADVFSLQDKVVAEIAEVLRLRLAPMDQSAPGGTRSPAAYDAYLRGQELYQRYWRSSPTDLAHAIPFFEQAIAIDPHYGQAYAGLAQVYWDAYGGWEHSLGLSPEEVLGKVNVYLKEALKHPSASAYRLAAWIPASKQIFSDAISDLEQAIPLDPSSAETYVEMAYWLTLAGRSADARHYISAALRLDPSSTQYVGYAKGLIQFNRNKFDQAVATLEGYLSVYPNDAYTRILLVAAYGQLGRTSDAMRHYRKANEYFTNDGEMPPWTILVAGFAFPFKDSVDAKRLRQGLVKAGIPELPFGYDPASKDRLTSDEIRSLLFGHTVVSTDSRSSAATSITFTGEGIPTLTRLGVPQTGIPIAEYASAIEGGALCFWWQTDGAECAAIFRNPKGSHDHKNEFLWIGTKGQWEFSVVK